MDRQLEKYRFGRTLKLQASAYTFSIYDDVDTKVSTSCICVADEVLETFSNHISLIPNHYILFYDIDISEVKAVIAYKWFISGYVCCG